MMLNRLCSTVCHSMSTAADTQSMKWIGSPRRFGISCSIRGRRSSPSRRRWTISTQRYRPDCGGFWRTSWALLPSYIWFEIRTYWEKVPCYYYYSTISSHWNDFVLSFCMYVYICMYVRICQQDLKFMNVCTVCIYMYMKYVCIHVCLFVFYFLFHI